MNFPKKCVVDTNVAKTANLASQPPDARADSDVPQACIGECVKAIEDVTNACALVVDAGGEIFKEYLKNLSMKGEPGIGDGFLRWVHDHQYGESCDRVHITSDGESYKEFPDHDGLWDFDNPDRKFVATANAHKNKPPILQATDSKWHKWEDALKERGITVRFLCKGYVKEKYRKKFGK